MENLLAGPSQFLDAALSSIEAELLSTDVPQQSSTVDAASLLDARRVAQSWQRVNWNAERQRLAAAPQELAVLLSDLPDPGAALATLLDEAARSARTTSALQIELDALKTALREQADARSSHADAIAERDCLQSQLTALQNALNTERGARDIAERRAFAAAEQLASLQTSHSRELEDLSTELDNAQKRTREAEAEATRARSTVTQSGQSSSQEHVLVERNAELTSALAVKERAATRLVAELTAARKEAADAVADAAASRAEANAQRSAAARLRNELERRPQATEIDALRRSVAALQACVHAAEAAEVLAVVPTCSADDAAIQAALPAALMGARRRAAEAEQQFFSLQTQLSAARSDAESERKRANDALSQSTNLAALVQRLEADLQACSANGTQHAAPEADGDASLLDVVKRQRDRLKQRASVLEDQLAAASRDLMQARTAAAIAVNDLHTQSFARDDGVQHHPVADGIGARVRKRVAALACLGGDRKAHSRGHADAETGAAVPSQRSNAGASRMTTVSLAAYVALLHMLLLRQALR
jgi:colicin import membrane protein